MKKYFGYVLVLVLLVLALSFSCAAPSPAPAPGPAPGPAPTPTPAGPIKIAYLADFTGYMAHDSMESEKGAKFKLEEVGYEVAGRKIEYLTEDAASDPVIAVDKARKLVENDKVDVILGPLNDSEGEAVAAYLSKSRTPNICVHNHIRGVIEHGGGNIFLWAGTTPGMGWFLGLYAYEKLGYRTAVAIHPDTAEGEDIVGGSLIAFEAKGGKVLNRVRYSLDTQDLAPYLSSLGKADTCFFWSYGGTLAALLTQYYSYGLDMPLLMPCFDALYEQEIAEVGDKCLGIIGDDFYSPEIDTALNKQFVDAYVKKHGYRPAAGAAGSYTATTMFLEAVKATKGDTSKDAIINALHNIKFESPIGMVSMSSESPGMGVIDMHVCKIVKKDGGYVWGLLDKYPQIVADVPGK